MPISVLEKPGSRSVSEGESPSADLLYVVKGTDDDAAARDALAANAPESYGGLVRKGWTVEPVGDPTTTLLWDGTVRYGLYDNSPPEVGQSSYSFDTGGGTQHITQSRRTVARYARSGETPADFEGAIGVTHDSVEGVDITVPVFRFSETHYVADEDVTPAYKANLFYQTGKVNDVPFKGFAAGEVLFLGASGSQRGDEDWEITFNYAASPNVTGLMVGDIGPVSKKGWEYLWVRYEDAEDNDAMCVVKRPVQVNIEEVYEYGAFVTLP
jgi:hypothetical protein